jgi:plasmid stability protein
MRYRSDVASIQIRNVPPKLHRELKRRAAKRGVSLQEYLLGQIAELAETPTIDEVLDRMRSRDLTEMHPTSAEILHDLRGR